MLKKTLGIVAIILLILVVFAVAAPLLFKELRKNSHDT